MTVPAAMSPEQKKELGRIKRRSWLISYMMILPAILFLLAFVIYPTISMFVMSLYYGNAVNPYKKFKGLGNYNVRPDFWVALRNTAA